MVFDDIFYEFGACGAVAGCSVGVVWDVPIIGCIFIGYGGNNMRGVAIVVLVVLVMVVGVVGVCVGRIIYLVARD